MRDVSQPRIEVVTAAPDRLSALAPVFGRAFVDEPMMRWPMGEHGDVVDRFTRCFAYFLGEVLGLGFVWEAGTAQGAAVWIPPDRSEAWENHPWNQQRIHGLTDDGGRRYDTFWDWVDSHSPDEPLWQLDSIAVDPAVQGRGLAQR
jgi:ribosomal protein S18 acetylase RimI-like enzyme